MCDGTRRTDVLITAGLLRIAVELDGPLHGVHDARSGVIGPAGGTQLRDFLLRADGLDVLHVPATDGRRAFYFASPPFVAWLRAELAQRGVFAATAGATPAAGVWLEQGS